MTRMRRSVQFGFLLLVLVGVYVVGGNCERWCPFGGVEALYTYVHEGNMICSLGTANFFILGGVLAMTLLMRRAFCGYACPIGTISEWLRAVARRLRLPEIRIPLWLDRRLALLKYGLLAVILWFTWQAGELIFRGFDPCYALISRHGADITVWTYVVAGAVAVGSLFVMLPFCRWLCPLAAVLNPFSRFAVARVRRDMGVCRDCGVCAKACPVLIPVDQVPQVTHARCIACLQCVDSCPHRQTRPLTWGPPLPWRASWPQIAIVLTVLVVHVSRCGGVVPVALALVHQDAGRNAGSIGRNEAERQQSGLPGQREPVVLLSGTRRHVHRPGLSESRGLAGRSVGSSPRHLRSVANGRDSIKQAIVEPYYEVAGDRWRMSPFAIAGYDPLAEIPPTP